MYALHETVYLGTEPATKPRFYSGIIARTGTFRLEYATRLVPALCAQYSSGLVCVCVCVCVSVCVSVCHAHAYRIVPPRRRRRRHSRAHHRGNILIFTRVNFLPIKSLDLVLYVYHFCYVRKANQEHCRPTNYRTTADGASK